MSVLTRRPVLVHPAEFVTSVQGQPLQPCISTPTVSMVGVSSDVVIMPAGHAAKAHLHRDTDVVVTVLEGSAITLWWDPDGGLHKIRHGRGSHLHIPSGVAHAAINPSSWVEIALEVRAGADFVVLPHLQERVDAALREASDYLKALERGWLS